MIKKLFLLGSVTFSLYANVNIAVSVLPEKTFVKAIGKDKVNVTVMVQPGSSPHTYEPKPSQMVKISKASIYYSIGVEFEHIWLDKFQNQNNSMKIVALDKGIKKYPIATLHKQNSKHLDPHIWTDPINVKYIAKTILDSLVKEDKQNQQYYIDNYNKFISSIDNLDKSIKILLKNSKKSKFMVFHPAWGYYARRYDLIQVPIEIEGKTPKASHLIALIKQAKKENIKAIFTAPEFSAKIAKLLAKRLNIDVKQVSPLNPNWAKNLINLTKAIAGKKK